MPEISMTTTGSSPTIQASWPDGSSETSPGPNSSSLPSSIRTRRRPDTWYWRCGASQLSVPAMCLTWVDQRQPGRKVARPKVTPPRGHHLHPAPLERAHLVRPVEGLLLHPCHDVSSRLPHAAGSGAFRNRARTGTILHVLRVIPIIE